MEGKTDGRSGTTVGKRARALALCVVLVAATTIVVGVGTGVASAQAGTGGPTPIDSCRAIDQPGAYVLTTNVTSNATDGSSCISITAENVVFDGGGHTIAGKKSGYAIRVDNGETPQSNVTVRNVAADRWLRGIAFMNATGGLIENTTSTRSIEGYTIQKSTNVTVRNNYAYDNALGIHVRNAEENTVTRNVANDNKWGIHLEYRARNNRVTDNVARNNSNWDLIARLDSTANDVSRLDVGTGTVSFVGTNVALKGTDSPPAAPSGQTGIDSTIEVTGATGEELDPALDSFAFQYRNPSGDASSLSIWRYENSWSALDSTVAQGSNTVSTTDVTTFGTFAVFGSNGVSAERATVDATPPTLTRESASMTTGTASATTTTTNAGETSRTRSMTETTGMATTTSPNTGETTQMGSATGTTETTGAASTTTTNANSGESSAASTTDASGPGFGVVAGLVALLAAASLALRRQD